jgi:hypothetical protein
MDTLNISASSIWFKLASIGGFKESRRSHQNSCTFIYRILLGVLFITLITAMSIGFATDITLWLIWLGLPTVVITWLHNSIGLRLLTVFGGPLIISSILVALVVFILYVIFPGYFYLTRFMGYLIPDTSGKHRHIRDFLSGICKPLKVIHKR